MPGLIGIVKKADSEHYNVLNARDSMKLHGWYQDDDIWEDKHIIASRTHLNVVGDKRSPELDNGMLCWVEGEMYNASELADEFTLHYQSIASLFVQAYQKNILSSFCSKVDGDFVAVIYDTKERVARFISDRYGLKPLYIWRDGKNFAWASEIKAFTHFSSFTPKIRLDALKCFMSLGHMMGNITWFEDVHMLSSSSILTYELDTNRVREKRYWTWENIKPQKTSFDEAKDTLGRLLIQAVKKRVSPKKKICVSLSGGLDSRVIVASIDKQLNIPCYTMGREGSPDIEIARQVAKVKRCEHNILYMNAQNWLKKRFNRVWKTDGMISLLHLHAPLSAHSKLKENFDITLNGFIGDLVCGASWLFKPEARISSEAARYFFQDNHKLDDFRDPYYNINHEDPYAINTRVRRFTNLGIIEGAMTIEQRKPFVDNKLLEFIYSLPDTYRINNRLYSSTLLRFFPDFFQDIPWQKTGIPISKKFTLANKVQKFFKKALNKAGILRENNTFADYPSWIREEKTSSLFLEILEPKNSLYSHFTKENHKEKFLTPHLQGKKDFAEEVCRAVTVEVWLQQVLNKRVFQS